MIYYYLMLVGLIIGIIVSILRAKTYHLKIWQAIVFTTVGAVVTVLGAHLLYILESLKELKINGTVSFGLSLYGGVYLNALIMPFFGKLFKLKFKETFDYGTIILAIGLCSVRFGCYFNGCCGGITILLLNNEYYQLPVQLFECAIQLLIIMLLLIFEKKKKFTGYFYPLYLIIYGVSRFFLEFIRISPKNTLGLSHGQWFAIFGIIIGLTIILTNIKKIHLINHPIEQKILVNNEHKNNFIDISNNYKRKFKK